MIMKQTKKGFTLVELLIALAILVLLIVGITTGVSSATRAYKTSTFESESATLAGIINTTLEDLLRYADADVAKASQAAGELKVTSEDYHLTQTSFVLEDGFIRLQKPDGTTSLDLVSFGSYPNLQVQKVGDDPLVIFDADGGYYIAHYLITGLDNGSEVREVTYRIRPANIAIEYGEGGEEGGDAPGTETRTVVLKLHYNNDADDTHTANHVYMYQCPAGTAFTLEEQDNHTRFSKKDRNNNDLSFDGWYKSPLHKAADKVSGTITLNDNLDLYAKWSSDTLTITFQIRDAATKAKISETTQLCTRGDHFTVSLGEQHAQAFLAGHPGYTLGGWYTDRDMTVPADGDLIFTEDTTLYAARTPVTYTVSFNANGGTGSAMASQTFTYGKAETLQPNTYSFSCTVTCRGKENTFTLPSSKTFEGWKDSAGNTYQDGQLMTGILPATQGGEVMLYAQWSEDYSRVLLPKDSYTSYPLYPILVPYIPYHCAGWYSDEGLTVLAGTPGEYYTPTGDVTLYPKYNAGSDIFTYQVNYNNNGQGTLDREYDITEERGKVTLPGGECPGYTLDYWRIGSPNGTESAGKPGDSFHPEKYWFGTMDVTLYAHWKPNSYVLSFNGCGIIPNPGNRTILHGDPYGNLPKAGDYPGKIKPGYDLKWFTEETGGSEIRSGDTYLTVGNQTLYAREVPKDITLTYDSNGGSAVSPSRKTVTFGGKYGPLPVPTNPGYEFIGWYTAKDGGTKLEAHDTVQLIESQTIYARWRSHPSTVEFKPNGGELPESVGTTMEVHYNEAYGSLPTPTRISYSFDGWYTAENGGTKVESTTVVTTTEDHILYAHWKPSQVWFLNYDKAPNDKIAMDCPISAIPDAGNSGYIADRYKFMGWYYTEAGTNYVYSAGKVDWINAQVKEVAGDLPVTAYWVRFDGGDVSCSASVVLNGSHKATLALPNLPSADGFSFVGWSDGSASYAGGSTFEFSSWLHDFSSCWIKLDANGGNACSATISGGKATLPKPTRTGYVFQNWSDGTNTYAAGASIVPVGKVTLTANWTPATCTVTLNPYGGSVSDTTTVVTYDSTYGAGTNGLPDATRSGYTFKGWWTDPDTGSQITADTKVTIASATQTLYAHWSANTYTIQFDKNGASAVGSMKNLSATYDMSLHLTACSFTRAGYIFDGWATSATGGKAYTDMQSVKNLTGDPNGVVTLYAVWIPNTYTIAFDGNSGSGSMSSITGCKFDTDVTLTANSFIKTGYSFNGWNTAANGSGTPYTDKQSVKNLASENGITVTLYAQWKINPYTITFDADGGSTVDPITKDYGAAINPPDNPTKAGYTFAGWNPSIPATMPAENMTIKATWTENSYTVTYDGNGGSPSSSQTVTYDAKYVLPSTNPTRTGYSFAGWFTGKTDGTQVTASTDVKITSAQTLYAHWNRITFALTAESAYPTLASVSVTSGSLSAVPYGSTISVSSDKKTLTVYDGTTTVAVVSVTFSGNNASNYDILWSRSDSAEMSAGITKGIKLTVTFTPKLFTVNILNGGGDGGSVRLSYSLTEDGSPEKSQDFTLEKRPRVGTDSVGSMQVPYGSYLSYEYLSGNPDNYTINAPQFDGDNWKSGKNQVLKNNVDVEFKTKGDGTCVVEGTLVTMADGTQKPISALTYQDQILTYNLRTGTFEASRIAKIYYHGDADYEVLKLSFSGGQTVKIIAAHGFLNRTKHTYSQITPQNYRDFIGDAFLLADGTTAILEKGELCTEHTGSYSLISAYNDNFITEGVVSITGGRTELFPIGVSMMYDEEQMNADIEEYGLFDYDEFRTYMSEKEFYELNCHYYKIPLSKGLIDYDYIYHQIPLLISVDVKE